MHDFEQVAKDLGWQVNKWKGSGTVDYVITWGDPGKEDRPSFSVKVLARDTAEQGEETWVVLRGDDGKGTYLWDETINLLAFESTDKFILVERQELQEWIVEHVEKDYVTLAHQALMKVYQKGKSMKTLVKTFHLIGLAKGQMKYEQDA